MRAGRRQTREQSCAHERHVAAHRHHGSTGVAQRRHDPAQGMLRSIGLVHHVLGQRRQPAATFGHHDRLEARLAGRPQRIGHQRAPTQLDAGLGRGHARRPPARQNRDQDRATTVAIHAHGPSLAVAQLNASVGTTVGLAMPASEQVEIDDARRIVLESVRPLESVELDLDDALGRVLAEDVYAPAPIPAFDSSAMDGFAVRADDLTGAAAGRPVALALIDESRAGHPAQLALAEHQAIAISTGAVVPDGADAVVRVERTRRHDRVVLVHEPVSHGAEIRRAGEDVADGAAVLERGTPLGPAQLGMLAALGCARVSCARRAPRLRARDRRRAARRPRADAPRRLRDSNSHSIAALARSAGAIVVDSVRVGDEEPGTRAAIEHAFRDADAVVICGGVSVGEHDHVRSALRELGARQAFWGLAFKPGHPTWFGTLDGTLVFGLPGNPVSAFVTFVMLAGPALRAMQGEAMPRERPTAVLDAGYEKPAGRAHAVRCSLSIRDDGWHVRATGPQGSHVLSSLLAADALAIVPSAVTRVEPGARVQIEPLAPWTGART